MRGMDKLIYHIVGMQDCKQGSFWNKVMIYDLHNTNDRNKTMY